MKHRKSRTSEIHYYSGRLKRKLEQLRFAPAAVVEAPSGYGKTTAIRDFLQNGIPQGTPVCWFTAVDESILVGFRRLCCAINKIDSHAGERLLRIGLPNSANAGEACDALRSMECNQETYLVIDNFQIIQSFLPVSFFSALVEHGGKGLHIIIIITQMLKRDNIAAIAGHRVLHITAADLRLNAEDIQRYYALAGVNISPAEAKELARYTEGWIIAVYLQLCAFRETRSISDTTGIVVLMEHLVWGTLTNEQQVFLLRLSPFETVTVQQACALTGCSTLPEYALEVLNNPFINYDPGLRQYEVHSILSELLLQKRKERGAEFERNCLLAAGDYYRDNGKIDMALGFYMQTGDYEKILSLDLSGLLVEDIGSAPFYELALDIARNCPYEIKQSHLLSMLHVAWALLAAGKKPQFDYLMDELNGMLENNNDEEASLLRGEWLLLSSWRCLPRLDEMTALLRQAIPLFRGTASRVILPSAPWCFGDYSQLAIFHSRPGEADREAEALEEFMAMYSRLTGGHGSGADVLFRAELEHYRGKLNEAEILAYQASCLAQRDQQSIVQLGAALHLAEIAVEKCDADGWQRAISSMEQAASYPGQNNFVLRAAVDTLRALLLNELKHQARIPEWLKNGDTSGRLLPAMQENALFVQLGYLMHEGKFARLAGMAEAGRKTLRPDAVLADTMFSLLAAVGYIFLGNTARAWECLDGAAQKAVPDGFVYLLAVYSWMLQGLPEKLIKKQYPEQLARFIEIKERFLTGFTALHTSIIADDMPHTLTSREREVASLAAEGLRNSEIAKKLTVSENTVRFHLRSVFQKLDIDRRAKLAEKLK